MVLFLFVIMLVNVKEEEKESTRIFTRQYIPAVVLVFMLGGAFIFSMARLGDPDRDFLPQADKAMEQKSASNTITPAPAVEAGKNSSNTQTLGEALYQQAALPFEVASVLLLVAIVGSVLLARGRKQEKIFD
jgi:NADH-quinone oxidoreductase subunit J